MPVGWKWRLALALVGIVLWSHPGTAAKIDRFTDKEGTLHIKNAEPEPVKPGGETTPEPPGPRAAPRSSNRPGPPVPGVGPPAAPKAPEEAPPAGEAEPKAQPPAEAPTSGAGNIPPGSQVRPGIKAPIPQKGPARPPFGPLNRNRLPGPPPGQ